MRFEGYGSGLGIRDKGLGFRVLGLGFGFGFGVLDLGFEREDTGFRVLSAFMIMFRGYSTDPKVETMPTLPGPHSTSNLIQIKE